jgi:hypothetical protein
MVSSRYALLEHIADKREEVMIRNLLGKVALPTVGLALSLAFMPSAAIAKEKKSKPVSNIVVINEDMGVPVFPYDLPDRPYTVIGEVKAGVRKATLFSQESSQKKIYNELWERGLKMGADAIVNAKYGDSQISLMSWGETKATGTAIKFLGPSATPTTVSVEPAAAPIASPSDTPSPAAPDASNTGEQSPSAPQ